MNVRLDKWLWAARFFKTRTLATDAIDNGQVRVAGERVKPARPVHIDDELRINQGDDAWEVVVLGLSDQRAAAPVARLLYQETAFSIARRDQGAEQRKLFREPGAGLKGRPTKRERRQLSKASTEL